MIVAAEQKSAFHARLQRIQKGQQFEHAEVLGKATHKAYKREFGSKPKKPRRTFADNLMVLIAFLAGMSAVLLGRIIYFNMSKMQGLPEAFYKLEDRGMLLFALILAGTMMALLHLFSKQRFAALLIGSVVMHYGEAAVASNAPEFWSSMFSADYAAQMAEQGKDYRVTPRG
ncbi:MAG TPA: hypothetical protein PLI43_19505 [Albidovulum sp.]|uniref:hypothetical protein n=1 Tax=Albidovulum sp. TaxID=1872424 RepID=UPI002BEF58D4|nr:hypothetical protein [Albidovulum sp.]